MPVPDDRHLRSLESELIEICRRRPVKGELLDAKYFGATEVVVGEDHDFVGGAVIPEDKLSFGRLVQSVDEGVVAIPAAKVVGAAAALNRVISGVGADVVGDPASDNVVVEGDSIVGLDANLILILVPVGEGPAREIEIDGCPIGDVVAAEDIDLVGGIGRGGRRAVDRQRG